MTAIKKEIFAPFLHEAKINAVIKVTGIPQHDGDRVTINFVNALSGQYLFHVAMWYTYGPTTLIFNTTDENGGWETEEAVRDVELLKPDEPFSFKIICQEDGYLVIINDTFNYVFKYRHSYSLADRLLIEEHVTLLNVIQI